LHETNPEQNEKASDIIDITDIPERLPARYQEPYSGRSRMHPASSIMFGDLIDTARALGAAEGE
jgi:hypothetical protein